MYSTMRQNILLYVLRLRKAAKRNPIVRKIYGKTLGKIKEINALTNIATEISEVSRLLPRRDDSEKFRLNLLVPSVDIIHVFGGIATAMKFFEALRTELKCEARIITLDASVNMSSSTASNEYIYVDCTEDSSFPFQLSPYNDRTTKTIAVRRNDLFVATSWWSAYVIRDVIEWQKKSFEGAKINPLVYIIQDYESGFYPWSSKYIMADSTYRMNVPTYAVFNSLLLKEYFEKQGYAFEESWYFDPILNGALRAQLPQDYITNKKKQILVYGRPGTPRNAFELICMSLREFVANRQDAVEWTYLSAGEMHIDVDLGEGCVLHSIGKLSLEGYAALMLETYAGISLMVSPHPSYPPLEMATFGVKIITNCFMNKDLHEFSDNIISVKACTPKEIARQLCIICDGYQERVGWNINKSYLENDKPFGSSVSDIAKLIKRNFRI